MTGWAVRSRERSVPWLACVRVEKAGGEASLLVSKRGEWACYSEREPPESLAPLFERVRPEELEGFAAVPKDVWRGIWTGELTVPVARLGQTYGA